MYDRAFFRSKLGRAALLSLAAMLAMNVVALHDGLQSKTPAAAVASEGTGLA